MTDTATTLKPAPGWIELRIWSEEFADLQDARIAQNNRARKGVDPEIYQPHIDLIQIAEDECKKGLLSCYRRVVPPEIQEWQNNTTGIGEHTLGRLLGHVGHPVLAFPHHWEGSGDERKLIDDEPFRRSVGQLWQYCGHGERKIQYKGMKKEEIMRNGSIRRKSLVFLMADQCKKAAGGVSKKGVILPLSPYREIYDDLREEYYDRAHSTECARCGPKKNPAQIGSPWKKGHQQAAALRITGKEILRDLWLAAGGGS